MCTFTLSLSCVTEDGGRVAGTQQHFGKERSETYGKASRKMGQWLAGKVGKMRGTQKASDPQKEELW